MVVKGSNQTVIVALKVRVPDTTTYDNGPVADEKVMWRRLHTTLTSKTDYTIIWGQNMLLGIYDLCSIEGVITLALRRPTRGKRHPFSLFLAVVIQDL